MAVSDEGVKKADSDIEDSDYQFIEQEDESDAIGDDSEFEKNIDCEVEDGQLGRRQAD